MVIEVEEEAGGLIDEAEVLWKEEWRKGLLRKERSRDLVLERIASTGRRIDSFEY